MSNDHGDSSNENGHDGAQKIKFTIVVNGTPCVVEQNVNSPLSAVIERALAETGNVGQPAESWELRDEQGVLLDSTRKISSYGFAPELTLFLSLKAGVGGC